MTQVKQNRKQVHEELMKKLFVQNHPYANLEPEGIIFKLNWSIVDHPGSFCHKLSYMCHKIWLIFWVWKWVKLQRLTMRLISLPLLKLVQSTSPIWIYLNIITNGEATLVLNYMREILEKQNHSFTQNIQRNKFNSSDNSNRPCDPLINHKSAVYG